MSARAVAIAMFYVQLVLALGFALMGTPKHDLVVIACLIFALIFRVLALEHLLNSK